MKAWEFEAVTFDGAVYCTECLPDGVSETDDDVSPIFACSEWDYFPMCDSCGYVHDYMGLTEAGYKHEKLNGSIED